MLASTWISIGLWLVAAFGRPFSWATGAWDA